MLKTILLGAGFALLSVAPALACTDIATKAVKLTGCVDEQWQAQAEAGKGALEYSYLTADQNFALQVITEATAFTSQQLQDGILNNAISAAGSKDNVKLINSRTETVDGKPFNELEYTVSNGKYTLTYQNLYYSAEGFGTVQILAFSTPEMATQAAFRQGQFASTVKLGG
jgi:hypothetical protein